MNKKPRIREEKEVIVKYFKKGNRNFKKDRFEKEKNLYKKLKTAKVDTPKLIEVDNKVQKLVLEKIDFENFQEKDKFIAVDELLKFQFLDLNINNKLVFKILDHPSFRLFHNSLLSIKKIGLKIFFKILFELIGYYIFYGCLSRKILIHNDFGRGHILKKKNIFYFIDLESAIRLKKWIFKDIFFFSINQKNKTYNQSIINYYIEKFKENYPYEFQRININKELKMAKIKYFMRRIYKDYDYYVYLNLLKKEILS